MDISTMLVVGTILAASTVLHLWMNYVSSRKQNERRIRRLEARMARRFDQLDTSARSSTI